MAFQLAYTLDGDSTVVIKDFNADASYTPHVGDVVKLNASGNVVAAAATDTAVLGVLHGKNFLGLVSGTAVASTNNPGTRAKVSIGVECVYRVPLKSGATAPTIGTKYGIAVVGSDFQLDTSVTTTGAIYVVEDYDSVNKNAFVSITARQLV